MTRGLLPFFTYYGGKYRAAPKYPAPTYDTLVEPFAGSAGYSLRYPRKRVVLCEIDPIVAGLWEYLIQVSPAEVLGLPDLAPGETVDDLTSIPQEAKWLIGFWLNRGVSAPRKTPSKWMRDGTRPHSFWGDAVRQRIAGQVAHIRHWRVVHGTYASCPVDGPATWFVDPPYQVAGKHYRYSAVHFPDLAHWCRSRPGQVIVCENHGADWLPFEHCKATRAGKPSHEVVWTQTAYDQAEAAE